MVQAFNVNFSRILILELLIQGFNWKPANQSIHWSDHLDRPSIPFIVDVFDDESHLPVDEVVGTDVLVDLSDGSVSLGQVHAALGDDIGDFFEVSLL